MSVLIVRFNSRRNVALLLVDVMFLSLLFAPYFWTVDFVILAGVSVVFLPPVLDVGSSRGSRAQALLLLIVIVAAWGTRNAVLGGVASFAAWRVLASRECFQSVHEPSLSVRESKP